MHITLRKAAAAACLLLAAGSVQSANPLQNAIITASYNGGDILGISDNYGGSNVSALDPLNTSVEFFTADALFGFDFAADGHLTIYNNSSIPSGSYKVSFDFGGTLNADIKSFTVSDAGVTGGVPMLSIVDPHTIALDLSAVEWNGDFNTLQTSITLAAAVPEPASVTMLVAGLLGLGMRARRRS